MPAAFALVARYCGTCREDAVFEQPECVDGHGGDCPEWACVECGEGIVVGFELPEQPAYEHGRRVA